MLEEDPALAEEWRRALEDPAFAGDPSARWLWWFRRTEFWDDTVGLMPVMRALEVPGGPTEPWPGAAVAADR
jgi:hypothetical protein